MPLAVKDFTWDETEKVIFITVPLKGVKAQKVDIFTTDEYLKVNFPPYLFECLLFAPVDDRNSNAQVGNGAVTFKLLKKEPEIWTQLQSPLANDKEEMKRKREAAIAKSQERAEDDQKTKAENKRLNEKYTLQEVMKNEENERQRIENAKESERKKATEDLEKWKEEQRKLAEEEKKRLLEERRKEETLKREEAKKQERITRRRGNKADIFEETAGGVPRREVGKIAVKFTPREFPTPERESVRPQEEEWLKKQAESRRIIELEDENLSEQEKDPMWLRDKGNEFFKAGNLDAAINAYSHALRLNHMIPSCYSNRAACHLKKKNLFKCVQDCSKALDLLVPPVPQNAASRCKCLVRRGTALCELEMYIEGLKDYEGALKLDPDNEQLKADAEKIRHTIQTETVT